MINVSIIEQVLEHSGELQRCRSLGELITVTDTAVKALTRYRSSWIAWLDDTETEVRVLARSGSLDALMNVWEKAPRIPRGGDAMVEEIISGGRPVVVVDARTDARTNKDMVAHFQNRTIINVPVVLAGRVRGMLGLGSFGDEGVLPPHDAELEAMAHFAAQLAPAFDRVQALLERDRAQAERERLQQQLQSLERVELMGVLSAGVAHDLNNLLSVSSLGLELVSKEALTPRGAGALEDSIEALGRMRDITRQLLQLGKPAGDVHRALELADRVASTVALVRPAIPRGIDVRQSRGASALRVQGDAVQLEQAFANLLLNARDALGDHGVIQVDVDERTLDEVGASRLRGARTGRFAHVRVSDDGPGLAPELKDRIFDPLFTTKATGTGLGLAVVSRVMQQHHGFVTVDSEPGRGTSFDVYLPAL